MGTTIMAVQKDIAKIENKIVPDKTDVSTNITLKTKINLVGNFNNRTGTVKEEDTNNENEVDFDDLLSSAGEFGRYQLLLFLSTFPFYMFGVFVYFTQLFMTEPSPNHWCWIPELGNLTDIDRRNLAIPIDENSKFGYTQCKAYVANWTDVLATGIKPNNSWPSTKCAHGWEFNKTEIPYETITSEMGWVCDKDSYQATAQVIFFLGSISGGFLIGWVADHYGRLPAAVISNVIGCIGGVISIFARNFVEFALCRFFTGIAYDNCMIMVYLLVLEYVAPKYRTLISNASFALFYSFSVTMLPWIVLLCGHWKTISLATSLPLALAVLTPLVMPESPRWLLSKGKVDAAVNKLLTIARINRKEIPIKLIDQFKSSLASRKQEQKGSMIDLLKRPLLRKMFICICLEYSCCALIFDGLVRSIGQLQFDFFISFSVISITEFPSVLILAFIMDWIGRRWLVSISLIFSGVFCILTVFVGGGWPSVLCAVIARFTVNMTYSTALQWGAEMLPVSVRGSGMAIIHIFGFIGYISSPYIVYLDNYIPGLPLVLVGSIAGVAAGLALVLPETAKKEMPQTFNDAEELIKNQKFWDIPCFSKNLVEVDGKNNMGIEI